MSPSRSICSKIWMKVALQNRGPDVSRGSSRQGEELGSGQQQGQYQAQCRQQQQRRLSRRGRGAYLDGVLFSGRLNSLRTA